MRLTAAALLVFVSTSAARAAQAVLTPEDVPRADASVLAALNRGDEVLDLIVGVRDDTPSAKALAAHPDPSGEPARRLRRLAAQRRLVEAMRPGALAERRFYGSFSALAARSTREGVLALANRRDVAWVTLDAVRRRHEATPQSSQRLIRSNEANALGIDGAGETIAILDTGVDYGIPGMGGGGFPNAKVVAGTDVADGDADPMDCEGHGTSVASVAAGPAGVAPAARIVALKIARTASCDIAQDSDILEAIDWAVVHREEHGIGVINLSFGGAPIDGKDHGYCDEALPQYATAVDAASASGIVFVASAGNEALTNAIAQPACLSTAISAGAVYPDSYSSVSWANGSGGTFCADHSVAPDSIVCFSNSASGLAVLAPGAFWNVETRGGAVEQFHGTSAAAPAVSGAAALLRQQRPGILPSTLASLLRAAGKPVADGRNGILTPRIDALGSIELSGGAFAPFDGAAVPIPDGSGAASAAATVSGFTGNLGGVAAIVQIEHDDPRQLVATLTGPDGTSVVLHNRSGAPARPINAVYGRTLASAQSLAVFQGKAANGNWTLTVQDAVPTLSGRIRNFAVRLTATQPQGAIPQTSATRILPLVGRVQGTKFFLSDVRLYNPAPEPRAFSLYYVPQGGNGSQAVRVTRTAGAGQVLALDDIVGTAFGYAESIGQLTLMSSDARFTATSRAYTPGNHGTFGLFVPSFASSDGIGPGETATSNGLAKSAQFHTNAGFAEVSGAPATVKMEIYGSDGRKVASTTRAAPANGSVLVTDVIGDRGLGATSNFRIDFTVTSGTGRVVPFATIIDAATGDGVFEPAVRAALSPDDIVIAQASHATGVHADFFRTNLHVTNLASAPATFTVSLIPRAVSGAPGESRTYTLAAGQTLEALDVLESVFGLADPSAAGLRVHPAAPARLVVSSRTYVERLGGTFGFSIPGLPTSQAIGAGDGAATVIQLDHGVAASGFRSNFGLAEVAGADAVVRVAAMNGDGSGELGARLYTVPAGRSLQASLGDLLPHSAAENVYLRFSVESGAGRVLAYGVAIDNTSGDAIYIPIK
jgi:Subtilase family/Proprotein convertase P-domain